MNTNIEAEMERFEEWVERENTGLCLDEVFASTDGVPSNPYLSVNTRIAFGAWMSSIAGKPQWMSIDTAPTDGTRILAWLPVSEDVCIAHNLNDREWRDENGMKIRPNLWMLLPNPPTGGGDTCTQDDPWNART